MRKIIAAAALALAFAASPALAADDYIKDAPQIVKAADWKAMETVRVEMGERGEDLFYNPKVLKLKANQPYKIELVNVGKKHHYYTAEAFFRSVALRKVQSTDAEVKAPFLTAVEVLSKGQLDLYVVPVTKGTYDVICTIDDHKDRGMIGQIVVE